MHPRSKNRTGYVFPSPSFAVLDRKSTRLNSSHLVISYAVFCLKKKKKLMAGTVDDRGHLTIHRVAVEVCMWTCVVPCFSRRLLQSCSLYCRSSVSSSLSPRGS